MKKGIKNKINLVNDISGLEYDKDTIQVFKGYKYSIYNSSYARKTKYNAKKSKI